MKHQALLFFLIFITQISSLYAQQEGNDKIIGVLEKIKKEFNVSIEFKEEWLQGIFVDSNIKGMKCRDALRETLAGTGFAFIELNTTIYVIRSSNVSEDLAQLININAFRDERSKESLYDYKRLKFFELTGVITDGNTNEPLVGISVIDKDTNAGTTSNIDGTYKIELPIGSQTLTYSGIGFKSSTYEINLNSNESRNVSMYEKSLLIDEIVISGTTLNEMVESAQAGKEMMKIDAIKKIPAFMGEVDVVKSIATLPGISSVGEGASGFNVRGGNVDQNLILFDGIPIYNSSHLFGFFSIFNPDIINDFTLYKGGISSHFGGRAASVLEVNSRNGDLNRYQLSGSIGLISNKLNLEGPILKNKASFLVSTRLAHPTWLFKYIPDDDIKNSKASFKDFNLKFHGRISDNLRLSSSSFFSTDNFRFAMDTTYTWNAYGSSISLVKALEKKSWSITGVYSKYYNQIHGDLTNSEFEYSTEISTLGIKGNYQHYLNDNDFIDFGVEANYYETNNGRISPTSVNSSVNPFEVENDNAIESALFVTMNKEMGDFSYLAGIRYSNFSNIGNGKEYQYANIELPTERNLIDSILYKSGKPFGISSGWEPRLNGKWQINTNSSLKISYQRMQQYMQMITKTAALAPNDYWKLSDKYVKPLISDQVSLGYYRIFRKYSIASEVYYKLLQNLVENRNGESTFLTNRLETSIVNASGKSYGIETSIEKRGKLNGKLSYTYSRTFKQINDVEGYESGFSISQYPSEIDRPHNLNVNLNYQLKRRVSVSANLVFISGRPITAPTSAYYINNQLIVDYSKKNNTRIESYHRVDVSLMVETNLKKDKWFEGSWSFSIYNVYGRKNPFSIYFNTVGENKYPSAYQLSILGNAFPSISYNFRIK